MAQLRYIDDIGQLQMKSLDMDQCLIGRAPTCQVVIVDDTISREHLRIDLESGGRFRIRDLGSRNKTFVNGELISDAFLNPGDVVRAGARVLEFLDDGTPQERADLDFLTPDRSEPPNCDWVRIKTPLSLTLQQVERLSLLLSEQRATSRAEDIAAAGLSQLLLELHAERGFIALKGPNKGDMVPIASRGLKRIATGSLTPVSQSFVAAPMLQSVAGRYPQTASEISTQLGYAAAAITAPLTNRGEVVGVLYVDRPSSKKPFSSADLQYCLAVGANLGAAIIDSAQRLVRNAAREGAAWITTLRRMQNILTNPVSSNSTFTVLTKRYAGRAKCGDFATMVHCDELHSCLLLVDGGGHGVCGVAQSHGLAAALRACVAVSPELVADPAAFFQTMNTMLMETAGRQSIPCTFVGLDLAAGKLAYINAGGMPPLLMVAPGRLLTLDQQSLILGVDAEYSYSAVRIDLPERFRLVCHSDGLSEAANSAGEVLGASRVHETLLNPDAFTTAQDALSKIEGAWTSHLAGGQGDDDALIVVIARQ